MRPDVRFQHSCSLPRSYSRVTGCFFLVCPYHGGVLPLAHRSGSYLLLALNPLSCLLSDTGTMFMYQFAILLATCRDILRPGCMWFIKDPQDPTFHPIRDILDRPTLAQLRKLCMSAMMYAVVISVGVGGIVWSLTIVRPPLLPLRWKMRYVYLFAIVCYVNSKISWLENRCPRFQSTCYSSI